MRTTIKERNKLILENMGLIKSIAYKYTTVFLDTDDLIQDGILGMIEGIKHYKPSKGKLSTGVYYYILTAINRSIANTENTVRIPVCVKKGKYYNEKYTLNVMTPYSLDNIGCDDGGPNASTFKDLIPSIDNTEAECINSLLDNDIMASIHKFLHGRELDVVKRSCINYQTLTSIAKDYGTCYQYVQQLRAKALKTLRLILVQDDYKEVI